MDQEQTSKPNLFKILKDEHASYPKRIAVINTLLCWLTAFLIFLDWGASGFGAAILATLVTLTYVVLINLAGAVFGFITSHFMKEHWTLGFYIALRYFFRVSWVLFALIWFVILLIGAGYLFSYIWLYHD